MAIIISGVYYDQGNKSTSVYDDFSVDGTGWISTDYRTISFSEPPAGKFLAWLQANAVKVDPNNPPVESSSWSVADISGASYKFALNSSGYYESNNKGVANSLSTTA